MRRLIPFVMVAALAVAGCGSSSRKSSSAPGSGARTTELSYFSAGSPLLVSIATSPSSAGVKGGLSLLGSFPAATFGEQALFQKLQSIGINYQTDIKPLFGNPIMIGAASPTLSGAARNDVLAVWVTSSASQLSALIKKIPGLTASGTHAGATLYALGTSAEAAVSGATLLIGSSASNVSAALDRHANGGGFSAATYDKLTSGLPQDTLTSAVGDLTSVLSSPTAANARKVPWVAAIRGYGAAITPTSSAIDFQYRLDTSGGTLSSTQLPIAAGTTAPTLAGSLPITVGVADPAQVAKFFEQAEQATSPLQWAKFQARQSAAKTRTGFNLDDLFAQLTGNLIISSNTHTTMGRVGVTDAKKTAQIIAALGKQPNTLFTKATKATPLGGGFYSLHEGKTVLTIGVAAGQLVVGKASVAQLRAFASAPTSPLTGAKGSVAFRVALTQLLQLTLKSAPPAAAQAVLSALGDITGWTQASPDALTGQASIAVK